MSIRTVFVCLMAYFAGPLAAQTPIAPVIPPDVRVVRDLVYARYGDRELELDLYLPPSAAARTRHVVVVVRGGGWRSGDKEAFGPMAAALAQRGVPAASIEYRTSTEAPFPAAVHDTKAAVRWLRANARSHGLDPSAVGAFGGSAGGHLVAYLGVTAGNSAVEGSGGTADQSSRVRAVVAMAPPVDLVDQARQTETSFVGVPLEGNEAAWAFASPISHVAPDSPPILLLHSEDDTTVLPNQSLKMATRYAEVGVRVELVLFPNAPHAFWNFQEWFDDTMDRTAAFFLRELVSPPN